MIPTIVGREVRTSIEDFLRTRYRISTPELAQALHDFIQSGVAFRGTYLSFQLPFVKTGFPQKRTNLERFRGKFSFSILLILIHLDGNNQTSKNSYSTARHSF